MNNELTAVITIGMRDVTKLFRDRTRIFASLIFPIIFIGVLGVSMQSNLSDEIQFNFLTFIFIGVLAQTLFQSTAAGIISLIEDRQNDFAQEMFVSPISRYSIIIGKILGEVLVSMILSIGIILFAFAFQVPVDWVSTLKLLPFVPLIAFFGGSFGVFVMSNLKDQKTANQIFPFLIFPQFFLAGVFSLVKVLPLPLLILSRISPLTYAVDLLRSVYYAGTAEYEFVVLNSMWINILVVSILTLIFILFGTYRFVQIERNR